MEACRPAQVRQAVRCAERKTRGLIQRGGLGINPCGGLPEGIDEADAAIWIVPDIEGKQALRLQRSAYFGQCRLTVGNEIQDQRGCRDVDARIPDRERLCARNLET